MIQVRRYSKSFGNQKAVDNISFSLSKGEILGFIGPNGAGKSTTIKLLLNYLLPDEGSAFINSFDVSTQAHQIKKDLAYVSSEDVFYPELNALDIISHIRTYHHHLDMDYVAYLITRFGIDTQKRMKELSLGNKKKVSLLVALMIKPKVLIMDEPTNGLDPLVQKILFEILREMALQGCAIFISSHNLKEVQDHCDRVMFIKDGRIIQTFDVESMRLDGKFISAKGDIDSLYPLAHRIIKQEPNELAFIYNGNLNQLLTILSQLKLDDISIEAVSMEHYFLEFYKDEVQ